ncbi:MAG: DUF2158 domain-containing protein [Desulfuromonadaceae bacterium]|nr:DUF2158 domain-containing protein [Desulfuromonadaceae bacterium]MDD5106283.1 DUF2158 domain-containing protein [Desulfuromonadaceae bacterium]
MEKFKAGDIVLLKSGSPAMTVKNVVKELIIPEATEETIPKEIKGAPNWEFNRQKKVMSRKSSVDCQWFVGNAPKNGSFPPESLIKVSQE